MLKHSAKLIILVLIIMVALSIVSSIGPLSHLPTVNAINESYFIQVRNHEILLGLAGFAVALLAGALLGEGLWTSVITAILAGAFYYVWTQAGDVNPVSDLLYGLKDFFDHYMLAGAVVVIATLVLQRARKT